MVAARVGTPAAHALQDGSAAPCAALGIWTTERMGMHPLKLGSLLAFPVAYLLAAAMSSGFMRAEDDVALVWLPAGLGYALLLLFGLRWWPLLAASVLIFHLAISPVPALFLPYSVAANTLGAVCGAWLYAALRGSAPADRLEVDSGFQVLVGSLALVLVSGLIGAVGLVHAGFARADSFGEVLLAWMLGDLFGTIALTGTALVVGLALRRRGVGPGPVGMPRTPRRPWEYLVWALALALVGVGVLLLGEHSGAQTLGLAGLPMALLMWAAVRFQPLFAFIATSTLAIAIATLAGWGVAGFTMPTGSTDAAVLVGFLCVAVLVPQLLALAIHENRVTAWRMLRRAQVDALTGLPNRSAFEDALRGSLTDPEQRPLLVAYLDLDQFKIVNDTLSHAAGDALLKELAHLLQGLLPAPARLYRIGGDEFGLLSAALDSEQARQQLEQVCEAVADFRFAWAAGLVSTRVSIGYAVIERDDTPLDPLQVLSEVDAACFTAKELGGGRLQRAAPGEHAVRERTGAMHWVMRLEEALQHDRFELLAQTIEPLHEQAEGLHFEVLLRKRDAQTGELLPPGEFIAAAERFGLASRLDRHVVERTLGWLEAHPQAAAATRLCSINLSASSLVDAGFARFLEERLARSSFPATRLCFELTETGALRDLGHALEFMQGFRRLGCRFALDDFGTGFCSFSYLTRIEAELLKIDGSFVREAATSELALAIVQSIVQIARVTGRRTVAEWVETPELVERMRELGVDYVQGHAIARPKPILALFATEHG